MTSPASSIGGVGASLNPMAHLGAAREASAPLRGHRTLIAAIKRRKIGRRDAGLHLGVFPTVVYPLFQMALLVSGFAVACQQ